MSKVSHEVTQERVNAALRMARTERFQAILITGDTLLLSATIIRKSSAR